MHSFTLATVVSLLAGHTLGKIVEYECDRTPQICLNTCWAINCAGHPNPLHGGAGRPDGRATWGYKTGLCASTGWAWITPDNKHADSPDEYPLDGSKEGGWSYNGKVISLRCVPQAEQNSELIYFSPTQKIKVLMQLVNTVQGGLVSGIRGADENEEWTFRWTKINNL